MAMEGCHKCMKITLGVFNILVLLVGGAVLGLGIYAHVTDFVTGLSAMVGSDLFRAGSILIIVAGAVTVVISFLGCSGAWAENRVMLAVYFSVILVLLVFFIAASIAGFVFKDKVLAHLESKAEDSLVEHYGLDQQVTNDWDEIQAKLECCGVWGDQNSNSSWAIYKLRSKWFQSSERGGQYVPYSCCSPTVNKAICTGESLLSVDRPPRRGPPVTRDMQQNEGLYMTGCNEKFWDFVETHALIVGGVALAAIFVMVIAVIFSICLFREIGNQNYVV